MDSAILEKERVGNSIIEEGDLFEGFGSGGFAMHVSQKSESEKQSANKITAETHEDKEENHSENTEKDSDVDIVDVVDDDHQPDDEKEAVSGTVEGHGIYFKTKDVARELGITVQDVRNYDKIFEEFLNVERTASGHRLFTREYIDKLAAILELKKTNNYTFEQTKEALSTDEGQIMSARDEMERLHKLLELMTSRIETSGNEVKRAVREEITETISSLTSNLLIDTQKNDEQVETLIRQNDELKEALVANQTASAKSILELKEQLSESRRQNEEIMTMLTSVLSDQQKKTAQMEELSAQNEKLFEEVSKKKKRWFFQK